MTIQQEIDRLKDMKSDIDAMSKLYDELLKRCTLYENALKLIARPCACINTEEKRCDRCMADKALAALRTKP